MPRSYHESDTESSCHKSEVSHHEHKPCKPCPKVSYVPVYKQVKCHKPVYKTVCEYKPVYKTVCELKPYFKTVCEYKREVTYPPVEVVHHKPKKCH